MAHEWVQYGKPELKLRRAFSLVELLVVVCVIGLLAGFIFPVMANARVEGNHASDLNKMRQLAVAGSLYANEYGEFPLRVEQLVSLKMVPVEIVRLTLDPCLQGTQNVFLAHPGLPKYIGSTSPSYPESLLTLGDFGFKIEDAQIFARKQNPAWAFSDTEYAPSEHGRTVWGERYQRIGNDGSVTTHAVPWKWGINPAISKKVPGLSVAFQNFFYDESK